MDPTRSRIHHPRQLVDIGALELRETAPVKHRTRQRKVEGEFFQNLFIGARRSARGLFNHGQLELIEQQLTELFGRTQIKGLPGQFVGMALELQNLDCELLTLPGQHGAIDQHTVPLDALQDPRHRQLDRLVERCQPGFGLQLGPEMLVELQGDFGIFGGIVRSHLNRNLVKRDL